MTRRRSTARRTPARGGQQGYEPPVTRMRRDERILELALERWSQRRIAAPGGASRGRCCSSKHGVVLVVSGPVKRNSATVQRCALRRSHPIARGDGRWRSGRC